MSEIKSFAVDDIVKGITNKYGLTDTRMTRARVLRIDGEIIELRIMSHTACAWCIGDVYRVNAEDFEKVGHIKEFVREEFLEQIAKGNLEVLNEYDLYNADLRSADLSGANLRSADLRSADLSGANLRSVYYDVYTAFFAIQCPEEGAFIGYKKASGFIVKLRITETAMRSSATSRKCRCSEAEVLSITTKDGKDAGINCVSSDHDSSFIYEVGKTVKVDDFEKDRWIECAAGIHFFITRQEAVNYF